MTYWTPIAFEDIMFDSCYRKANGGSEVFSMRAFYDMAVEIREGDNCRLSNILNPMFTIMSPWKEIFPWLNGLLCAGIIWLIITKIAKIKYHLVITGALIWASIVVFLPWRDLMFLTDYSLNYVFPSFLTLLFIYLVVRADRCGWSSHLTVLIIVLATPVGAWHEVFFAAAISGFCVWAVLHHFRLPPQWWLTMIVYTATALIFALSPGILQRAVREIIVQPRELPLGMIAFDLLPCVAIVLLCGCTAISHAGRRLMRRLIGNEAFVVLFVSAVVGTLISVVVTHRPRTSFWPNLCAIATATIYLAELVRFLGENRRRWLLRVESIAAVVSLVFCIFHGTYCLVWQHRLHLENEYINSRILAGDNEIYCDLLHPVSPRMLTLAFQTSHIWMNLNCFALTDSLHGRHIAVLPTALRDIRPENTDILGGRIGVMRTGNALWTRSPAVVTDQNASLRITLDDGSEKIINYAVARRFPLGDGDSATYIDIGRIDPLSVTAVDMPW